MWRRIWRPALAQPCENVLPILYKSAWRLTGCVAGSPAKSHPDYSRRRHANASLGDDNPARTDSFCCVSHCKRMTNDEIPSRPQGDRLPYSAATKRSEVATTSEAQNQNDERLPLRYAGSSLLCVGNERILDGPESSRATRQINRIYRIGRGGNGSGRIEGSSR